MYVNFMRIRTSINKIETNMTVAKRKPQKNLHKILSCKSKINIFILTALKVVHVSTDPLCWYFYLNGCD